MDEAKKSANKVDRTGQRWGQYHIISTLEQGRFSKAYLGEHVRDRSKQFVIDILPMPLTKDHVDVFLQHARRLTQLVHPHILRLVDVGIENFVPFIVIEYVSHTPLRQLYKREGQPLDKLLPYLKQAMTALQYAHDQDVLHKNIRPENVLVGWSSGTLLCDFAIDVVNQDEHYQNYQRSKDPIDAIAYIAPEQIHHQACKASDQYSLAVMVYEWLCGTPPFLGSYFEVASHHLNSLPLSLQRKVSGIPSAVDEVVLTALAKDPARRFASVSAFIHALAQAHDPNATIASSDAIPPSAPNRAVSLASNPVVPPLVERSPTSARMDAPMTPPHVPPSSVPMPARPPVTPVPMWYSSNPGVSGPPATPPVQNPAMAGSPLAATVFSSSGTIASPIPGKSPPPVRRPQKTGFSTRRAFVIAVAGLATLGGGGAWLLSRRLHPDSPKSLPAPNGSAGTPAITPSPGGAVLAYRAHQTRVNGVAWSPDGKSIASAGDDKLVLISDSTSGKTVLTYNGHTDVVNGVAWSRDGQFIASASADKTVQVWEALTGKLVTTYKGHSAAVNSVSWSSDGRIIASGSDDHTVQAWLVMNEAVLLNYQEHTNTVVSVAWSPDDKKIASGSWDTTVQVISAIHTPAFAVGDKIFTYKGHAAEVYAVAWAPNGKRLASAGGDNVVQVCNGIDGSTINYPPRRHDGPVRAVAWSPDIRHIVSASDDKTVRVWNSATGENTTTFRQHTDAVFAVDWSPDSQFVTSGGADKTVQVFAVS